MQLVRLEDAPRFEPPGRNGNGNGHANGNGNGVLVEKLDANGRPIVGKSGWVHKSAGNRLPQATTPPAGC